MDGGQTDANRAALEQRSTDFPNAKVQTREEFVDNQISGLSSILNVLYVLLALSVVVSLFGIVNTLVLTVFERTREIGMLRAIGMTRRQVRRMIRHESVITAADRRRARDRCSASSSARCSSPASSSSTSRCRSASWSSSRWRRSSSGILAAIFPARRAARLNILEALKYE